MTSFGPPKLFDTAGLCAVTLWLVCVGVFVWRDASEADAPPEAVAASSERVTLRQGHRSYLAVRGQDDAGVGLRTHTFVEGKWIVEHERALWTTTDKGIHYTTHRLRALVDKDGHLQSYSARREGLSPKVALNVSGVLEGQTLRLSGDLTQTTQVPAQLTLEPLLASLAASLDWVAAQERTWHVLNPMTGEPVPTTVRFSHRERIDVFERQIDAMIFDRIYSDQSKDVWAITDQGWVVVEKLPDGVNVSSVPDAIHRSKKSAGKRFRKTTLKRVKAGEATSVHATPDVLKTQDIDLLLEAQAARAQEGP